MIEKPPMSEPKPEKSEEQRRAEIEAYTKEEAERGAKAEKRLRLEATGGISQAAVRAVKELFKKPEPEKSESKKPERDAFASDLLQQYDAMSVSPFERALQYVDSPERVEQDLIWTAIESTREALGSSKDFQKIHADVRVQKLYQDVDQDIRHYVLLALQDALAKKLQAALDNEDDAASVKIAKLLSIIEKADEKAA